MINAAEIFLWGTKIGTIWKPDGELCANFEYDGAFLRSGIEVSPFMMPLSEKIYRFPELSRVSSFHGLPGLLADSLPDKFGNAVINAWLQRNGRNPESFTAIERLCYTGKRGMGALEFIPSTGPVSNGDEIDVNEMAEFASEILSGRENARLTDRELCLARMIEIGSSAGGARAKAVVAWNPGTGEIRSGQIELGRDFQQWLIKFDGVDGNGDRGITDNRQHTRIEYAYYLMATAAGIRMQECRLLEKDGRSHFMTLRYDRQDGEKIHTQTLAALGHFDYDQPGSCSYEQYAELAKKLNSGSQEIKQLFRRTVFNCIAMNCDDHVKNFSFMMDRRGKWKMTPAYDITFAYKPNHRWLGSHQMSLDGKSAGISRNDLMKFGRNLGLSKTFCEDSVEEIMGVVNQWMSYAERCGIVEERAQEIENILRNQGEIPGSSIDG